MSQLNRKTLRKLILMEIRKVLQEQQIDTSNTQAIKYVDKLQTLMASNKTKEQKQEEDAENKKKMGIKSVENITDSEGNVIKKKVTFIQQEPGPSYIVPAKFDEEK